MFDPNDRDSWYQEGVTRDISQKKLQRQPHGTFLVRPSTTLKGDYVLSVSENSKVSHYIINKVANNKLKIGDQFFDTMPELLEFYKIHYLDTTTLIQPVVQSPKMPHTPISMNIPVQVTRDVEINTKQPPPVKQKEITVLHHVKGLFDFKSDDPDDLPFTKGEILEVIEKPEENWWNARNQQGQIGQIPVPYVETYNLQQQRHSTPGGPTNYELPVLQQRPVSMPSSNNDPVYAEVITRRVPNAYDPTALALEVGDRIKVTLMNKNGQWEGYCNGKHGRFPFTHVKLIE